MPTDTVVAMIRFCAATPWLARLWPNPTDRPAVRAVTDAWEDTVDRRGDDPRVLAVAGRFFLVLDEARSEALLERAVALSPRTAAYRFALARMYLLHATGDGIDERSEASRRALVEVTEGLRLAHPAIRLFEIPEAAEIALWAGALDQAEAWATYALSQLASFPGWRQGDVVHRSHQILGHVALLRGDLASARIHLLESAKGPTSPVLASFGPTMSLARLLLERGEKVVVLEYLHACARIWKSPRRALEVWIPIVEAGGVPDFGTSADF